MLHTVFTNAHLKHARSQISFDAAAEVFTHVELCVCMRVSVHIYFCEGREHFEVSDVMNTIVKGNNASFELFYNYL